MVTDILVVFLLIIGFGTIIYWTMKFALWFMDKLIKKSDDYETMKEKNYAVMVEEMKQFDQQTLNLAYLYAKSLISYGADVTEKWDTAVEQSANLEKAYRKGFYEGISSDLVPDNATNGDVVRFLFPHLKYTELRSDEWWNAPYTKGE